MHTVNDFFCGCGGMGLGFQGAGYKISGAWDFDRYAVATYKHNVGDHVKQADITEMTWRDVPRADVWAFGFPCQDLSIAGKQAGLLEGTRSRLFFEIMRLLDETAENAPDNLPLALVAENVKQLKPYIPILEEEYEKRRYTAHIKLFNSKYYGVAQSRERYFIVGTRNDLGGSFAFTNEQTDNVPHLSEFLDRKPVSEKYYVRDERARTIIGQALDRLERLGRCHATLTPGRTNKRQNGRRAKDDEEEMFTLTAQDLHGVIIQTPRGYNKGNVHDVAPAITSNAYEQNNFLCLDGAVIDDEYRYDKGRVYTETAPALRSVPGGGISRYVLVPEGDQTASALIHSRGLETRKDGVAHCLKGAEGGGSKVFLVEEANDPLIPDGDRQASAILHSKASGGLKTRMDSISHCLRGNAVDGSKAFLVEHAEPKIEVIGTLEESGTTQEHNNRVHDPDGISPTLTAVAGGTHHIKIFDYMRYRVRRLTPTEYGRLQAFPVDERWEQVVSDSQAYKQFGNAVTVTVARSVAESLKAYLYTAKETDVGERLTLEEAKIATLFKEKVRYQKREYIILRISMFPSKSGADGWGYQLELTTEDFHGYICAPLEFVKKLSKTKRSET